MSIIDETTKNELNNRKEILNKHLAKFNQLKQECKWSEAWNQLLVTLNYANDTLKYSANLLKNISQKMPQLSPDQQKNISSVCDEVASKDCKCYEQKLDNQGCQKKKFIVIPKNNTYH